MGEIRKKNQGITLIALIVTIIVLLILAGVVIATLTGENGLLTRAAETQEEKRAGDVQEQVRLWQHDKYMDENLGESTAKSLEDFVADLVSQGMLTGNEKDIVIGNSEKGIEAQYRVTIGSKEIIFIDKVLEKLRVGDYVAYTPEASNYTVSKDYSGYDTDQSFSTEDLGWRVLNINDNGTIDLISSKPTAKDVYFYGANGYNNGVYLLNEMCSTLYSNGEKGATARCLNIEDIQDKIEDKTLYTNYRGKVQYGQTTSYGDGYNYYPVQWKNDNGTVGESESRSLISSNETTYNQESGDLTVTQTYWYKTASEMQTAFKEVKTQTSDNDVNIYYQLLCNNGADNYWLSSRMVTNRSRDVYGAFGLRVVIDGYIDGYDMFGSSSGAYSISYCVRPVVSVPSSMIDVDTGDGTSAETAYGVK